MFLHVFFDVAKLITLITTKPLLQKCLSLYYVVMYLDAGYQKYGRISATTYIQQRHQESLIAGFGSEGMWTRLHVATTWPIDLFLEKKNQ